MHTTLPSLLRCFRGLPGSFLTKGPFSTAIRAGIFVSFICASPVVAPVAPAAAPEVPMAAATVPLAKGIARSGPFAVVEWNPADLLFDRVRVQGEYVIVDGFAFGGLAEYQKQSNKDYRHATTAVGVTATQYFESQALRGAFIRGEMAGAGSVFERKDVEISQEQGVYGLSLGADLGYRFLITERLTGGASYGARRVVPDFFGTQGESPMEDWRAHNKVWTMRVQATLGVAL
jgi:hypothetical protein